MPSCGRCSTSPGPPPRRRRRRRQGRFPTATARESNRRSSEAREGGKAFHRALKLLSYRPRSAKELRENLLDKGFPAHVVEKVLEELSGRGLIDDVALARELVTSAQRARRGRSRIYGELRRRSIERAIAEKAVGEFFDPEKEADDAAHLLAAELRKYPPRERGKAMEKAAALLARRGFSPQSISRALEDSRAEDPTSADS